jgi:hypothetical protein
MRPRSLALLVASLLALFTPAALAQPGCSDATLADLARHRARFFAATRALQAATGVAAAEAAAGRWEALSALFWATSQPCDHPSPQVAALRRPLLGVTEADARAALGRASLVCARVARREHLLGLTLSRCVLGANSPAPRYGWTPTPRPGMRPFFEGTARESAQMFTVARSSLAAMRSVEAQPPLAANDRAIVTSQRLALAAMAAAVGDAALVNETLAPLGASPEASELRAELAATLGDGVGAIRTLREAAAASPGSAVVHAALAQAIWFFARPGRPDIDPRLLGDLARERWYPLAYDHARVALCVAPDDADPQWLERVFVHVQTLQAEVRGANAWGTWSTAPQPPPPLPVGYLGRPGRIPPPTTEGFEESCEALMQRAGVSARAREPWPTRL